MRNASGLRVKGGVFSGISVTTESLESLMTGGVAMATPENPDMGGRVTAGHRFRLHAELKDEWLGWRPVIPVAER